MSYGHFAKVNAPRRRTRQRDYLRLHGRTHHIQIQRIVNAVRNGLRGITARAHRRDKARYLQVLQAAVIALGGAVEAGNVVGAAELNCVEVGRLRVRAH